MAGLFLARLASGLITLWAATALIFVATELLPGDAATALLGKDATAETLAAVREELDLNRPAIERYGGWLAGVLRGDFGRSLINKRPVADALWPRLQNSVFLAFYTAALAIPLALALGFASALRSDGMMARIGDVLSALTVSLPEFFVGYLLVLIFAVHWQLFPSLADVRPGMTIFERAYITFLPMLTLSLAIFAQMYRQTRAALMDEWKRPYVEMAELKGLSRPYILTFHVFRNALAPIIYAIALNLAHLILGVVVVETIFVYPGIGQWMVDAVAKRDLPVVQICGMLFAGFFVLINLLAEWILIVNDPRLLRS